MAGIDIEIKGLKFENAGEELDKAIYKALETSGLACENFAKRKCPVDTGNLRNSITHTTTKRETIISSAVKYAIFVEMGTGKYAESGGRKTPWTYKDSGGNWHMTDGQRAQPYMRPALSEHIKDYKKIFETELSKLGKG